MTWADTSNVLRPIVPTFAQRIDVVDLLIRAAAFIEKWQMDAAGHLALEISAHVGEGGDSGGTLKTVHKHHRCHRCGVAGSQAALKTTGEIGKGE